MAERELEGRVALVTDGVTVEEAHVRTAAASPMNRMLQPEEVAAMVAFLRAEGARGVTMEDIDVAMGSPW